MPEPKLKVVHDDTPVQKVIATGLSLVVGLSDNQQITFQSGYEGDEDDSSIKARLDRMMLFASHLTARARIPDLKRQIAKHVSDAATFQELTDRAEKEHPHQIAARQVEIDEIKSLHDSEKAKFVADMDAEILKTQELRAEEFNAGLEEYRRSGRQGSYVPRGAREATLKRIDSAVARLIEARDAEIEAWEKRYADGIAAAEADLAKKEEERKQTIAGHQITIGRHQEAIEALEAELADCQATIDGG